MSKPERMIAIEKVDVDGRISAICQMPTMYLVTYKKMPFVIKKFYDYNEEYKYERLLFMQKGSAELRTKRLNEFFNCNDFETKEITPQTIY